MILTKTTQMSAINRYSRVLVPLPPVKSIKDEVGKLVEETFNVMPEYVVTSCFDGYAISWRGWYGFEDYMRYPSMRSFFPIKLRNIIADWLEEDEEMQMIEWIDEDRWEWLDVKKDYAEIFHAQYLYDTKLYSDYLSIRNRWGEKRLEIVKYRFDELEEMKSFYPVFRVLARRGYWNCSDLIVSTRRDEFYEKIGFDFSLPFG